MLILQFKSNLRKAEIPPYLESNTPRIKASLISWFLITTFNFPYVYISNCWLNWYAYILEIVLDIFDKLLYDYRNICLWMLILNEIHIALASLIICSINKNLANISLTPQKKSIIFSTFFVKCTP